MSGCKRQSRPWSLTELQVSELFHTQLTLPRDPEVVIMVIRIERLGEGEQKIER